jgi:hypothetical protein
MIYPVVGCSNSLFKWHRVSPRPISPSSPPPFSSLVPYTVVIIMFPRRSRGMLRGVSTYKARHICWVFYWHTSTGRMRNLHHSSQCKINVNNTTCVVWCAKFWPSTTFTASYTFDAMVCAARDFGELACYAIRRLSNSCVEGETSEYNASDRPRFARPALVLMNPSDPGHVENPHFAILPKRPTPGAHQ